MLPTWLNYTLQIIAALIVIGILYIITLAVINVDSLVVSSKMDIKPKEKTLIIDGYAGPSFLKETNFNTLNPFTDNYKRVPKSVNRQGGTEFTYQFWLKIEDTTEDYYKDLVILLKGINKKYKIGLYNKDLGQDNNYKLS